MVGKLLQRAAPGLGEWALEEQGGLPYWTCANKPWGTVYVLGQLNGTEEFDRIWATLGECGCGQYTEQNTVMLNWTSENACCPDNIHVLPKWSPPAEGAEDHDGLDPALGGWLLGLLDGGVPVPRHLRGDYWEAGWSEAEAWWHVAALAADLRERPYVGVDVEYAWGSSEMGAESVPQCGWGTWG